MKFVLFVEGRTEGEAAADFFSRWLNPQLNQRVGINTVKFDGYADLVRKMKRKAHLHFDGPSRDKIIAVIGLLDLYGPEFYPAEKRSAAERFDWAKRHFEREVEHPKFRMFFAVYEFEAWLLSQPSIFPTSITNALPPRAAKPETVNFHEPPAKLLDQLYRREQGRSYKKTTNGKQLFSKLDPTVARDKCPYLKLLLDEMLSLARQAGLGKQ